MQEELPKILTDRQRRKIETRTGYSFNNPLLIDQIFLGKGDSAEINAGRKPGRFVRDRESLADIGRMHIKRISKEMDLDADFLNPSMRIILRGKDYTNSAEALIGAVAYDCGGKTETIAHVIGVLLLSSWRSFTHSFSVGGSDAEKCPA